MATLTENLQSLVTAKENLRSAINAKGGELETTAKLSQFATAVEGLPEPSAGGTDVTEMHRVRFFDYDGTLLKTEYVATGESATAPTVPTHQRLDFVEWNNPFDTVNRDIDTGAIYMPTGATAWFAECENNNLLVSDGNNGYYPPGYAEMVVMVTPKNETTVENWDWDYENDQEIHTVDKFKRVNLKIWGDPNFPLAKSNVRTIVDWGDGTISDSAQGEVSNEGYYEWQKYNLIHDYANYGTYVIKIKRAAFFGLRTTDYSAYEMGNTGTLREINATGISLFQTQVFGYAKHLSKISLHNVTKFNNSGDDGQNAIIDCLVIPKGCTFGNEHVFSYCTARRLILPHGMTVIPNNCFYYGRMKEIFIPSTVTEIKENAFRIARDLNCIYIPDSVTTINYNGLFDGCEKLTSCRLPLTATNSDVNNKTENTFCNTLELYEARIPEGVTKISRWLLRGTGGDYKVRKAILPSTITTIEANAWGDDLLQDLWIKAVTPPTLASNFVGTCVIHVPAESVNAYKTASGWSDYATQIVAIQEGELE